MYSCLLCTSGLQHWQHWQIKHHNIRISYMKFKILALLHLKGYYLVIPLMWWCWSICTIIETPLKTCLYGLSNDYSSWQNSHINSKLQVQWSISPHLYTIIYFHKIWPAKHSIISFYKTWLTFYHLWVCESINVVSSCLWVHKCWNEK